MTLGTISCLVIGMTLGTISCLIRSGSLSGTLGTTGTTPNPISTRDNTICIFSGVGSPPPSTIVSLISCNNCGLLL